MHITLAPTTWNLTNRFIGALQRDPGLMRHARDGTWIEPVPLGSTALPTIAVVHGIVLTSDDHLLLAKRSARPNSRSVPLVGQFRRAAQRA